MTIVFNKTWESLLGESMGSESYWIHRREIPLGSLNLPESYEGTIPMSDIVRISFDDIGIEHSQRTAMNILLLGGSGDGKSLLMKTIWHMLHYAGYHCLYIDPLKTQCGNARMPWKSPRIPPHLSPSGIPLQHYMPIWSVGANDRNAHNFRKFATRLTRIDHREMWQGLGMQQIGASKTAKIIKRYLDTGKKLNMGTLKAALNELLVVEDIAQTSYQSTLRVLTDLEDYNVVDEKVRELGMLADWQKGYSVCISYNKASRVFVTFDVGQKIRQCADINRTQSTVPIMIFLDDSSYYARHFKAIDYNFAVQEITEIGNNYRGDGVYNCMGVQSLSIIDETVAETYKIKIISPLFARPDSLKDINIPQKAINYLKHGKLKIDRHKHIMQYLLCNANNDVIPFYPFTPPCNHFQNVYTKKTIEEMQQIQ